MVVSNSHPWSRGTDVRSSGTSKRRRFDSQDQGNVFQLQYQSRRDIDVNFHEKVVLTVVSGISDHVSSFMCSINEDLGPDLKAECISETEIFNIRDDSFSKLTSASSVVSLKSEEMESLSKSTPKKNNTAPGRKPPLPEKIPAAELEEFFSEAEKYEQKRFSEKYNYDIVKDVPMEGRYQWVRLKP